ncbi:TniQ family protein [Micromonospora olivasterospora]|uniref:TniQ protein n=1 Tax=Micromonospora olivasterospora TaxID=1880 RepID=A0A562IAN0_MICOL|nr:TniQ family protein [Micromonospora olivasterospora]TWH68057.1 TniQ protein [Micromonospora olivasterospora]
MSASPTRRLPIPTPPAAWETITSYLRRLAKVNHTTVRDLEAAINASPDKHSYRQTRTLSLDKLSALTGHSAHQLRRALLELQHPEPQWWLLQAFPRPACPPCARRHRGGPVHRYYPHHVTACVKHNLWLGTRAPAATAWPVTDNAIDIQHLPEITSAQVRHRRLVRRHGQVAVLIATRAAFESWEYIHGRNLGHAQSTRLDVLRPGALQYHEEDPAFHAANYPEIVSAASVFVRHQWQAQVTGQATRVHAYAEFGNCLDWSMPRDTWQPGRRSTLTDWIDIYARPHPTNGHGFASAGITITGPRPAWTVQ